MADYTQFNLRGDTKSNWLNANPVLSDREIALETDTQRFKIGNGTSYYNQLPYGRNTGEYLNFYNVTALAPLTVGNYYTHETAILAVPSSERVKGTIVSYETSSGVWYTERFIGSDVANWSVLANWEKVPDAGDIAQLRSDLNQSLYDVSSHNDGAVFESLQALLSSSSLSTLIPISVRCGGMSIRFIQDSVPNSDNKYVQFRYKLEYENTTTGNAAFINTDNWAICTDIILVENPEFAYALTDAAKHLLLWIRKKDAGVDWAVGVPKPVKAYVDAYITEILNGNIGTNIDGLNKVIAFLNDFSTSNTLAALLNTKVDKVEGKALIDEDVAEREYFEENPEFVKVLLTLNGKIVEGITTDERKQVNIPINLPAVSFESVENQEWVNVVLDKKKRILEGTNHNEKRVCIPFRFNKAMGNELKLKSLSIEDDGLEEFQEDIFSGYNAVKKQEDIFVETKLIPYTRGTSSDVPSPLPDAGYDNLVIAFMTDNHIDLGDIQAKQANRNNVKDAISFINNLKIPVSVILEGGDAVTGVLLRDDFKQQLESFFNLTKGNKMPFLYTKGNHDINAMSQTPVNVLTDDDWSELYYDSAEEKYGIVRKTKLNGKKSGYFYYDIEEWKVRIISADCYDLDFSVVDSNSKVLYQPGNAEYIANEQFNWIVSTALDFDDKDDKDWGVIVLMHYYNPSDGDGTIYDPKFQSIYGKFNRMLKAFNTQDSFDEDYTFSANSFFDLSIHADWSKYANLEKKPYLIGVISGHAHTDCNYDWDGVTNIVTANQGCDETWADKRVKRIAGTTTQNLFDLFSIDLKKRNIKAIRYGAGVNCYGNGGDRFLPDGLVF